MNNDYSLRVINLSGSSSIIGRLIKVNTARSNSFTLLGNNETNMLGVIAEGGISSGLPCAIKVNGSAYVFVTGVVKQGEWIRSLKTGDSGAKGTAVAVKISDISYLQVGIALESGSNKMILVGLNISYKSTPPSGLILGETSVTAYRGDRGKIAYDHSQVAHAPANAEQNVNADWNSIAGDSLILNKPTIPNGIPSLGATTQILQYSSAGVAKWITVSGDATIADGGALSINKVRLNVRNETGTPIASTKAVYMSGFNNLPLIALGDNTVDLKYNVIGLTIAPINSSADGFIAVQGQCDAETNLWNLGDELYLTTAGGLTNIEPTVGVVTHIGIVTVKQNYPVGKILLYRLPESNVIASTIGADIVMRVGDIAGVNKISFRDYANAEVASINSDGVLVATSVNGLTAVQATDLTDGGETTLHSHAGGGGLSQPQIMARISIGF